MSMSKSGEKKLTWQTADPDQPYGDPVVDPAMEAFTVWFVNNYPTDSILSNPAWHAPKIFRAAIAAIASPRRASQDR